MSNPKGNPNIVKYGFKTDRTEPLKERVQIRVPASLKKQLQADRDNIQCLVANDFVEGEVSFGKTQYPSLTDYADGVNTVEFLLKT